MEPQELKERTKQYTHRTVKLAAALPTSLIEHHIAGQLIRCSTSVAANDRAACLAQSKRSFAQSKRSFVAKLAIVLEEIDECGFWIEFVIDEELLPSSRVTPLLEESEELGAIVIASRKTARNNLNPTKAE